MVKAEGPGARWNLSVAQGLLTSQPGSLGRTFPYFITASEGGHAAAGPDGGRHGQMPLHSRARGRAGGTEQGRDASGATRPAHAGKASGGSWSPLFLPKGPDAHRRPLPVPGEDKLRPPPVPKPVLFKSLKLMCFMDS